MPIEIKKIKNKIYVELCYVGIERFLEPFFYDSIIKRLKNPFTIFFRQQIEIKDFIRLNENIKGLKPSLFIFHMSRCGSTLVAQMLASLEQNIVYSEPMPVDHVLRINFDNNKITEAERINWLKAVINKLGEVRSQNEKNLFIKFDSWLINALPLIKKAFPDVPCIFLYRSPLEVMVSHSRQRGTQMVPGLIQPGWFGFDNDTADTTDFNKYTEQVLEKIMNSAIKYSKDYSLKLINYIQLPNVIWENFGEICDIEFSNSDLNKLKEAAMSDAKNPGFDFNYDSHEKRKEATKEIVELSESYLESLYKKLEHNRLLREI